MFAYPIKQFGVDHLERVELPMLQIAPGMVLIKVHAVSLNYRDLIILNVSSTYHLYCGRRAPINDTSL